MSHLIWIYPVCPLIFEFSILLCMDKIFFEIFRCKFCRLLFWCIMACDMFSHNMAYICHANIVKQNLKGMNKQIMMHIIYFVLLINIQNRLHFI